MENYQGILQGEFRECLWLAVGVMLLLLLALIGILVLQRRIQNKKERIAAVMAGAVLIATLFVWCGAGAYNAYKIKKDMDHDLFLTYYGAYEMVEERSVTVCYVNDGKQRIQLRCLNEPEIGLRMGHVVYSKNSLYVVDVY